MLIGALISLGVGILTLIRTIFQAISNFSLTTNIETYINQFFSYARIADGILPMSHFLLAIFTILQVAIAIYTLKLILFAYSLIPFIGKKISLPKSGTQRKRSDY